MTKIILAELSCMGGIINKKNFFEFCRHFKNRPDVFTRSAINRSGKTVNFKRAIDIHEWVSHNNLSATLTSHIQGDYHAVYEFSFYYEFKNDEDAVTCALLFGSSPN